MSDSDDTDYLLLIPPDFFSVPFENEDQNALKNRSRVDREIVDVLVSQVSHLENRINAIESFENSLVENFTVSSPRSFKSSGKKNNYQEVLKWVSLNDFGAGETGEDVGSRQSLNRSSSSGFVSGAVSEPKDSMSSPSKDYRGGGDGSYLPQKKLELTEVDRLLKEMETTQRDIEDKLRLREQDFSTFGSGDREQLDKTRVPALLGDNIGSVPDLGFGVRALFNDSPKSNKTPSKPDPKPITEEPCVKRSMYLVGGNSSDQTDKYKTFSPNDYSSVHSVEINGKSPDKSFSSARRKLPLATANYNYRSDSEKLASPLKSISGSPVKSDYLQPSCSTKGVGMSPSEASYSSRALVDRMAVSNGTEALNRNDKVPPQPPLVSEKLLSLNELWKGDDETISRNPIKLKQKLEEEKYRRLHLENTVQALQRKVMEEQEKLAVAIQVDEKKDLVIDKVTEAWKKMVDHWKQIEEQRHTASQALLTERAMSKRSQEEINKRVVRWEREVSQALDLAAGFKAKAEGLERELLSSRGEMLDKLQESEGRITDAELLIRQKDLENNQLKERLEQSLQQLHEERQSLENAKVEIAKLHGNMSSQEAEIIVVKEQRDLLALRLKEETGRIKHLEQQKQSLDSALVEASAKQKEAEESCISAKKHLDTIKSEIKSLYQSQMESVVREKLAEFQSQLESARDSMKQQLDTELSQARESARRHQQSLVNSHVAEMRRLESIHKEEMTSLERRLSEAETKCAKLELAKRNVALKLHKVMENQWQQALGIITGDLSVRQVDSEYERGVEQDSRTDDVSQSMDHESPCKEMPNQPMPPHFSNQTQLHKYIEMMLEKHPGRPVDTLDSSILHDTGDMLDDSLQTLNWNNRAKPMAQTTEGEKESKKPPWK